MEVEALEADAPEPEPVRTPVAPPVAARPPVEPSRAEQKPRAPVTPPPSTDFDLVIEDPDEVSTGAVSVDELEDEDAARALARR